MTACEVCQHAKYKTTSLVGLLQPLPVSSKVWEDLSLDFISGLPKVRGFDTVLVMVHHLTKYAHFIAIRQPYIAKDIAVVFIKEVVKCN